MSAAKKERVSFENPDGAEWYAIFKDDEMISFCCVVFHGKSARFKSNWTVPEYRRQGCLQMFIKTALKRCAAKGATQMTAFCTPFSLNSHLRNGAKIQSVKKDITFVKYVLSQ